MKFIRRAYGMHLSIGKRRKKKRIWRRPKGRDNKMRESRKGRSQLVSIGHRGKKEKKNVVIVYNLRDLGGLGKDDVAILGKTGKRKRHDILKKADEMKISFKNINVKKQLKRHLIKNGPK